MSTDVTVTNNASSTPDKQNNTSESNNGTTTNNNNTTTSNSASPNKSNKPKSTTSSPNKNNSSNNNNNNNNNQNNSNNNNNNKESDDEDDIKLNNIENKPQGTKSSYYHFASTDPKEAEKFKPKKIDPSDTNNVANASNSSIKQGASAWNTGATMEQFDYTQWVFDQIKEQLPKIEFKDSDIKITEIESIDGHATILFSRGKFRPGFDINFKAKYSGKIEDNEVEGTIVMDDICMDDDEDDWGYDVSSKKGGKHGKSAARMIRNYRDSVISVLHVIFEEFKKKK